MIEAEVVIVGGGPAGSTCARELKRRGIDALVLDKSDFPRPKLCAGWITPKVFDRLELSGYPHSLIRFERLHFHFHGRRVPVRTLQYAIRRVELDGWLLERAGVPVVRHTVKRIERFGRSYLIDDAFRCTFLVGAGGTYCPVYRRFFRDRYPRARKGLITTLEQEFEYDYPEGRCNLWFFDRGLPGYAWYVPKGHGCLNVGIGGALATLKSRKTSIRDHWNRFARRLETLGLVRDVLLSPRGHTYYLGQKHRKARLDNIFLIGDSAGLATRDMGEGIGPAVESGLRAATAIARGEPYEVDSISSWSLPGILAAGFRTSRAGLSLR